MAAGGEAQQAGKVARIGFLGAVSASEFASRIAAIRAGLRDLSYVEGTHFVMEFRWAEGNYQRLPELAADLVRSSIDVIVTYGTPGSLAAKRTTTTVPIVMAIIGDPVAAGVVASVGRPGGNITGQSFFSPELMAKRIELLKEMMPRITRIASLVHPDNPANGSELQAMQAVACLLNLELVEFPVRGPNELEVAFDRMVQAHVEAVLVADDGMLVVNASGVAALAMKRRLPSIGSNELAQAGGLISYGVDFLAAYRRVGIFVDKILKGTKPAALPIEQATRFRFVLNMKTAKALGLDVPTATLLRADEVIE